MDKKKLILIAIIVIAVTVVSASSGPLLETQSEKVFSIDFVYSDVDNLANVLATKNISMSAPTEITDYTAQQYCMYFDDNDEKKVMKRCLTTALVDSNGVPFGNINIGADSENESMALALIEATPFLDSQEENVSFIFQTMIETLVCSCWEEQKPGGFESVKLWLNAAEDHYLDSGLPTTKSQISGLADKQLILEITNTGKSYLWTLIVVE